jgi:hypothetical protein
MQLNFSRHRLSAYLPYILKLLGCLIRQDLPYSFTRDPFARTDLGHSKITRKIIFHNFGVSCQVPHGDMITHRFLPRAGSMINRAVFAICHSPPCFQLSSICYYPMILHFPNAALRGISFSTQLVSYDHEFVLT